MYSNYISLTTITITTKQLLLLPLLLLLLLNLLLLIMLGNIGDYQNAQKELYSFLRDYPLDFDAHALLQGIT